MLPRGTCVVWCLGARGRRARAWRRPAVAAARRASAVCMMGHAWVADGDSQCMRVTHAVAETRRPRRAATWRRLCGA